tara:strand:- start:4 stop:138 length:135 start_codon:yes stop_codon:yes gene_type:complete
MKQLPSHVGLFHKIRRATNTKNEALKILRPAGYSKPKKKTKKKK